MNPLARVSCFRVVMSTAEIVQHLPDLERFAHQLADQSAEAQDLVQETCRRALEARA